MRIHSLLSAILRGQFLLEESAAQRYYPIAHQLRTGQFKAEDWAGELGLEPPAAFAAIHRSATSLSNGGYDSLDQVTAGSVSIVRVEGPMMEEDTCFGLGMASLGQRILEADAHENIIAHVVKMNTPGGSVAGLERFENIITGTRKPLVVHYQQMCSAGFWAGSGANYIMGDGRTSMSGSIGTKFDFDDYTKMYEIAGVVEHSVRATASYNKNAAFDSAAKGDYAPLRAQLLDPINDVFLSTVRANRAGKLPTDAKAQAEVLSGLVYIGATAVEKGLADGLGTLQEAIQMAFDLADEA